MINVGTTAIGVGLTRGCDTLVSQVSLTHLTSPNFQRSLSLFLLISLHLTAVWQSEPETRGSHHAEELSDFDAVLFALLGSPPQLFQHSTVVTTGVLNSEVK